MTDINKVTGMEVTHLSIMMRNSAHTIFFSKSGKENDSVLNRVKSGGLKNDGNFVLFPLLGRSRASGRGVRSVTQRSKKLNAFT